MLNLEHAIAEWRRQMLASGIKAPDVLDELESHLRDELDHQLRRGLDPQDAFQSAIQNIGQPKLLKTEFAKLFGIHEAFQRARQAVLTLAGIPDPTLAMNMNTTNARIEPGWATYLKGAVFVLPAISLWAISLIFVFPKLQQICSDAGVAIPGIYHTTRSVSDHHFLISGGLIAMFVLLEWRAAKWPNYRRATVGVGVFVINTAVLLLITTMVILAVMAAPELARK